MKQQQETTKIIPSVQRRGHIIPTLNNDHSDNFHETSFWMQRKIFLDLFKWIHNDPLDMLPNYVQTNIRLILPKTLNTIQIDCISEKERSLLDYIAAVLRWAQRMQLLVLRLAFFCCCLYSFQSTVAIKTGELKANDESNGINPFRLCISHTRTFVANTNGAPMNSLLPCCIRTVLYKENEPVVKKNGSIPKRNA